jgi:hypothetical protein
MIDDRILVVGSVVVWRNEWSGLFKDMSSSQHLF